MLISLSYLPCIIPSTCFSIQDSSAYHRHSLQRFPMAVNARDLVWWNGWEKEPEILPRGIKKKKLGSRKEGQKPVDIFKLNEDTSKMLDEFKWQNNLRTHFKRIQFLPILLLSLFKVLDSYFISLCEAITVVASLLKHGKTYRAGRIFHINIPPISRTGEKHIRMLYRWAANNPISW